MSPAKIIYLGQTYQQSREDRWTFEALTEGSFNKKMETFFNKKCFSLALRFAISNGATPQ